MAIKIQGAVRIAKLPEIFEGMIELGFLAGDGFVLLAAMANRGTNATPDDFPDKTGYECFINSIHVDDYVDADYLVYACRLVEDFFAAWRRTEKKEVLRAIISSDEFGATVKFHVHRDFESWISEDIEAYENAVLVADSTSINLI